MSQCITPPQLSAHDAQRFDNALAADDAAPKLRELVETMEREGLDQCEIYLRFAARHALAAEPRAEDLLGDALDAIWGWCRPENRWFSRSLSNPEIEHYQKTRRAK